MDSRRQVTIWQIVIACMILIIIAALALPAINYAQHSARIQDCSKNLKRIGLAMQQYENYHHFFPAGMSIVDLGTEDEVDSFLYHAQSDTCDYPNRSRLTAFTSILPYLNKSTIYEAYNLKLACCSVQNGSATSSVVSTYLCPYSTRKQTVFNPYYDSSPGATDYALSIGNNSLLAEYSHLTMYTGSGIPYPSQFRNGVGSFAPGKPLTTRHFRDGLVNTLFVGEAAGGPEIHLAAPKLDFTYETVDGTGPYDASTWIDQAWSQAYVPHDGRGGTATVFAATGFDCYYDENSRLVGPGPTPGYTPLRLQVGKLKYIRYTSYPQSFAGFFPGGTGRSVGKPIELSSAEFSMSPFRSRHPYSALFLMADGNVRAIAPSIDLAVYQAMASIKGGEDFTMTD